MLEQSQADLHTASTGLIEAAEVIAHRYLVSELEQNLIPFEDALRTIDARRAQNDETWSRAVHGVLTGLAAAGDQGFHLTMTHTRQKVVPGSSKAADKTVTSPDNLQEQFFQDPKAAAIHR